MKVDNPLQAVGRWLRRLTSGMQLRAETKQARCKAPGCSCSDWLAEGCAWDGVAFQPRVEEWVSTCFGAAAANDRLDRTHRFLEEALELGQACGCTREDAVALLDYVFNRPAGETVQEVGGVMVTLAALCGAHEIDLLEAGEIELTRVWNKLPAIRAKQASKTEGSPLPGRNMPA